MCLSTIQLLIYVINLLWKHTEASVSSAAQLGHCCSSFLCCCSTTLELFLWTVELLHLLTHLRPGLRHFSLFRHNPHCSTRLCTMARYKCIGWLIDRKLWLDLIIFSRRITKTTSITLSSASKAVHTNTNTDKSCNNMSTTTEILTNKVLIILCVSRVVFVMGKPGNFPVTGSDLPPHWFVWKLPCQGKNDFPSLLNVSVISRLLTIVHRFKIYIVFNFHS